MPTNRSIVITGASSGIGAALAQIYAAPGATLWLTGRDAARLEAVSARARDAGAAVNAEPVDVADRAAMDAWLAGVVAQAPPDLVIANAGISGGGGGLADADAERVRDIFAVNFGGVLNTVLPVLGAMRERGSGQIAIMASMAAFRGLPSAPAYAASKAAAMAYGDGLRGMLRGTGVAVSVICPGFVVSRITDTNDFPMPFLISADRAARIIRRGLERRKARIAFPWRMHVLMRLIALLPVAWTDGVLARAPRKT